MKMNTAAGNNFANCYRTIESILAIINQRRMETKNKFSAISLEIQFNLINSGILDRGRVTVVRSICQDRSTVRAGLLINYSGLFLLRLFHKETNHSLCKIIDNIQRIWRE